MNKRCPAKLSEYGSTEYACVKTLGHAGRHTTDSQDRDNWGVKWPNGNETAESRIAALTAAYNEVLQALRWIADDHSANAIATAQEALSRPDVVAWEEAKK